jgi:uncharacterized membrane protein YfcA
MDLNWLLTIDQNLIITFLTVIVAGVVRGYTGFGAALIIIPIVGQVYTPLTAITFHVLIEMPTLLVLLPMAIKSYDRQLVNGAIVRLFIVVPIGIYFISSFPEDILHFMIGMTVVIAAFLMWWGVPMRFAHTAWFFNSACYFSGLCQGLVGLGGPPVVTTLLGRQDDNSKTRSNIIIMMTVLLISSLLGQIVNNVISWFPVILALHLFIFYVASNQVGKWIFFRHLKDKYRNTALIFLSIIGVYSIVSVIS